MYAGPEYPWEKNAALSSCPTCIHAPTCLYLRLNCPSVPSSHAFSNYLQLRTPMVFWVGTLISTPHAYGTDLVMHTSLVYLTQPTSSALTYFLPSTPSRHATYPTRATDGTTSHIDVLALDEKLVYARGGGRITHSGIDPLQRPSLVLSKGVDLAQASGTSPNTNLCGSLSTFKPGNSPGLLRTLSSGEPLPPLYNGS
jgi:hypothetical protein